MTGRISKKTEMQLYAMVILTWLGVVGLSSCACTTPTCGLRVLGALVGMGAFWKASSMIGKHKIVRSGCEASARGA